MFGGVTSRVALTGYYTTNVRIHTFRLIVMLSAYDVFCVHSKLAPVVELASDDDFYHDNSNLPVYSRCTTRLDTQ